MKPLIFLLSLTLTGAPALAGTVNFLEVDNDTVLFSTSAGKTSASPACVTAENAHLWSVSLASDSGRAIYSLILTKMAKGEDMGISVQSAQDCGVRQGVERASKVNLVSTTPVQQGDGPKLAVYNWDGSVRLGTFVGMRSQVSWYYLEDGGNGIPVYNQSASHGNLYYSQEDCTGTPMTNTTQPFMKNEFIDDGRYFTRSSSSLPYKPKSQIYSSGNCQNGGWNGTFYEILLGYQDPQCGSKACILVEE